MALKLITAPASLPVTVAEAKQHMRIDGTEDDTYIAALIAAAVDAAELITGRQLVEAEYEFVLDKFPYAQPLEYIRVRVAGAIELPRQQLLAVSSITYLDVDGVEQTLSAADYTVDAESLVGCVCPAWGKCWPLTRPVPNAVRIRFTCGWPMSNTVSPPVWTGPEAVKAWIKVRVATMYEQREAIITGQQANEVPRSFVDGLLDAYRIYKVV